MSSNISEHTQMYPQKQLTTVSVEALALELCGQSRPGHFDGVTTVVTKLFNIVLPDIAYFGQKDAQQVLIIKKMVKDLNQPVKIKILPIVREDDGLAMSSRNAYLTKPQRKDAVVIFNALNAARAQIQGGQLSVSKITLSMKRLISQTKSARIDYIKIVNAEDLFPKKKIEGKVLIAVAVKIGKTRLIDNIIINL